MKRIATRYLLLFASFALADVSVASAQDFGRFQPSQPETRWLPDNLTMVLLRGCQKTG